MKRSIYELGLIMSRIDHRHIRLGLTLLALILFVLGAGAPSDHGD